MRAARDKARLGVTTRVTAGQGGFVRVKEGQSRARRGAKQDGVAPDTESAESGVGEIGE